MCSRYAFIPEPAAWADFRSVLAEIADELLALPSMPKLAPTDRVPIVVQQPGSPAQVIHARWGFIPHWWSKPELPRLSFNARSEEAAGKPMWRDALRSSRCLIPATTWFEWQHAHGVTAAGQRPAVQKIPHALAPDASRGFMFAGLWSLWRSRREAEPVTTCAILTTAASDTVASVHDRMPVVLAPSAWASWLDPRLTDGAKALELLRANTIRAV